MKGTFVSLALLVGYLVFFSWSAWALFYDFETANQANDWKVFAGEGKIENGKYILQNTNANDAVAVTGALDWTDCTVTCKVTMLEGSEDNIGIIWRVKDNTTLYWAGVRLDQRIGFCGCINGAWMNGGSPINPQAFSTKTDEEYELKLIVEGKSFQFYIDGKDMGEWEDDQLEKGMIGFRVYKAILAVDEFDVNGPGISPTKDVKCQGKIATVWSKIKAGEQMGR